MLHAHSPSEFNRKPRGLNELDRWKATKLLSFMLELLGWHCVAVEVPSNGDRGCGFESGVYANIIVTCSGVGGWEGHTAHCILLLAGFAPVSRGRWVEGVG